MNALLERYPNPSELEGSEKATRTILVADDDIGVRKMLARLLSEEDYHVVSATNGIEAIELAQKVKPDLVLLDLNMPCKDGWDTYAQLMAKSPELPIIVITARQNQYLPARFAGVGALMEKPLDLPALLETIRELLDEPVEARLAWLMGKTPDFHYFPPKAETPETDEAFK